MASSNRTLRLPADLADLAELRAKQLGYESWTAYIKGLICIDIIVREDEHYWPKRGQERQALVLDQDLAEKLRTVPAGMMIVNPKADDRARWLRMVPQKWLKPYVGGARLPLHRLRGMNADAVAKITADAMTAKLAGEKAAAKQLGHTTTKTTIESYLSS